MFGGFPLPTSVPCKTFPTPDFVAVSQGPKGPGVFGYIPQQHGWSPVVRRALLSH